MKSFGTYLLRRLVVWFNNIRLIKLNIRLGDFIIIIMFRREARFSLSRILIISFLLIINS